MKIKRIIKYIDHSLKILTQKMIRLEDRIKGLELKIHG